MRTLLSLSLALSLACAQVRVPALPGVTIGGGGGGGGSTGLLQSSSFTLVGGFRVPCGSPCTASNSFTFGGYTMAYDPNGNGGAGSIFLDGNHVNIPALIGELSIPALVNSSSVSALNTATLLSGSSLKDLSGGISPESYCGSGCQYQPGGIYVCSAALCGSTKLITDYYIFYDANSPSATHSHYIDNRSTLAYVSGPYAVGASTSIPNNGQAGGWVAGPMMDIPSAYQASGQLNGKVLTGQCCLSIITRTSWGPSSFVFDPSQIGVTNPVPVTQALGYDTNNATFNGTGGSGGYTSAGTCCGISAAFNASSQWFSAVWPSIGKSVLYGGVYGARADCVAGSNPWGCQPLTGYCYGDATTNPALDSTPSGGTTLCYELANNAHGPHFYPYKVANILAYKADDLVSVVQGTKKYYQIFPYASWNMDSTWPITQTRISSQPMAMAVDNVNNRLFIAEPFADGDGPVIWVYAIAAPPAPAPTPLTRLFRSARAALGVH